MARTKEAALYVFYSQFLPAYEETAVPDDATLPYITYDIVPDSWGSETALTCSVWYRSTSWAQCNAKTREIGDTIGIGGIMLPCDGGAIWLKRGTPFAQNMTDDDDAIRRKYINITAEFITAN